MAHRCNALCDSDTHSDLAYSDRPFTEHPIGSHILEKIRRNYMTRNMIVQSYVPAWEARPGPPDGDRWFVTSKGWTPPDDDEKAKFVWPWLVTWRRPPKDSYDAKETTDG